MTPEQVLSIPPKVLSRKQRESYFADGYLLLEKLISDEWLERVRGVTSEVVERSRQIAESDKVWDLEEGHTAESPRLRRLSSPNDYHEVYWALFEVRSGDRAGQAGALGAPRPEAVPHAAGLVGRVYLDLRPATGGRVEGRGMTRRGEAGTARAAHPRGGTGEAMRPLTPRARRRERRTEP